MGATHRQTGNDSIIYKANYQNTEMLKMLVCNLTKIEVMAEKGDGMALATLVDLRTVLGVYGNDRTCLTEMELKIAWLNLVFGYTQCEIGKKLGIPQKTISYRLHRALDKMSRQLSGRDDR